MKKKNILKLMAILMVALVSISLVSCGDDDDESDNGGNSIRGIYQGTKYYVEKARVNGFEVIRIANENTLEIYGWVSDGYYKASSSEPNWNFISPFDYKSGWYTPPKNSGYYLYLLYTYVRYDNKLVLSNGTIYTISGNNLIKEGDGEIYRKVQ